MIAVLTKAGCGQTVHTELRLAFEQTLALQYLLQADSERRALAYQAFELHGRVVFSERCKLAAQTLPGVPELIASDSQLQQRIAAWKAALAAPGYAAVEAERRRARTDQQEPAWYALWGGPADLRDLAAALGQENGYRLLYATEFARQADADPLAQGGKTLRLRPLRDPQGLPRLVLLAAQLAGNASDSLLARCGTDERRANFKDRRERLVGDQAWEFTREGRNGCPGSK